MPRSALCFFDSVRGSDGWLSTGASIRSSTIIASAKPPVKHMPTAPMPGPPHSSCICRAERPHPHGDRAGLPGGERGELLGDAGRRDALHRVADAERPPGLAEQDRQHRGEPRVGDAAAEVRDLGRDAGHLVDDDHRRPGPLPVHGPASCPRG